MNLTGAAFISHFGPPLQVHCLRLWRRGSKEPPDHLPRCLYEQIGISNGTVSVKLQDFRPIAWPVVEELCRQGKRARPEAKTLSGALHDALKAAGVEVVIGRPARSSRRQ